MKRKTVTAMLALLLTAALCVSAGFVTGKSAQAEELPSPLPLLPPVMQEVTKNGGFDDAATDLLIRVDADCNATDAAGNVIAPVGSLAIGDRTPVYYVSSAVAATNLAQYLVAQSVAKAVVASSKPELLVKVREKAVNVSGMLDCRSLPVGSRDDWDAIRRSANAAWARAVLLPDTACAGSIRFLRRLSFAVYTEVHTATQVAAAVGAGANGLLAKDPSETAAAVREGLHERGYSATLVNARFAKPLDEEMLTGLAAGHKLIVTMEENVINGGFGEHVTEFFSSRRLKNRILNIAIPDTYVEHGNTEILCRELKLDAASICERVIREYI